MEAVFSDSTDQRLDLHLDENSTSEYSTSRSSLNKVSRKTNVLEKEHGGNFQTIVRDTFEDYHHQANYQAVRGNSDKLDYLKNYSDAKIKTKKSKKIKDFIYDMSPMKSLPNATCSDKNCLCYKTKRHRRQTGNEDDTANVRNAVSFNINSGIQYSPNNVGSADTNHSFITKERTKTNKIQPVYNFNKSSESNVNNQKIKTHAENKNGELHNEEVKTTCDPETNKPARKTLSLSAWTKIHESLRFALEQKQSNNYSETYMDIKREHPATITVQNDKDSKLKGPISFHEQSKQKKNPPSSFEVKSEIKTTKIENQPHSMTSAKMCQPKVEPNNSHINDPNPSQQMSFIRNDIGVPVLFSPQRLTASPLQSGEATDTSKGSSESSKFPYPVYSTYGTIPSPSKTLNSFYVLPYLIVPAKTFSAFSSQNSRDDSTSRPEQTPVHNKAPLNKSANCTVFSQKSWSGDNNRDMRVLEKISSVDNGLPVNRTEKKATKMPKKCISKPKQPVETCKNYKNKRKCTREINKMKFALSLELMKKERTIGNEITANNIIESTKTGRITFVPAAQIRTTEADTCYTLQVVSVIKTHLESECRHTLGWTPAAINKTTEGHINMVFAPKVCKGLYLIEDMFQKTDETHTSGRQDVRLIPFAPFLELPKTCLALAIGNEETTWGACVDFLKQLKPFSLVPEVVSCIVEGWDCACSNVSLKQKDPEFSVGKKKSKFVSLTMPSCHCCQCQPNQSRKKAKGNK